jgi:hypothetical protein
LNPESPDLHFGATLKPSAIPSLAALVGAAAVRRARRAALHLPPAALALLLAGAVVGRPYGACAMAQEMTHQPAGAAGDCSHEGQMPGHPGHSDQMCCICCGPACCGCAPPPVASTPVVVAPVHTIEIAAPAGVQLFPRASAPFRQPPPIGPPPVSASFGLTSVSS